jgi:Sulfotransferase family
VSGSKKRSVLEMARGTSVSANGKAGTTRGETLGAGSRRSAPKAPRVSGRTGTLVQRLKRVGQRIARKGRVFGIRARQWLSGESSGVDPKNVVWIFGAGRTGSTWLSRMMGELEGHTVWFEPWVGALFDPYHLRLEDRKGKHFILSPRYRGTWLRSIRNFVLEGAEARFPEVSGAGYLVIKEPGGSVGAPLLMEALAESRMVLLVRDPRDVVASWMDARRKGGWRSADEGSDAAAERVARRAKKYLRNVGGAKKAYDLHEGRKVLVRYEELRADALGTMRRIYTELGIPVGEGELVRAVKEHSWEKIPEEDKGEGKFYRKATPGGWREDLTPEQVKTVEKITAPLLSELYPS